MDFFQNSWLLFFCLVFNRRQRRNGDLHNKASFHLQSLLRLFWAIMPAAHSSEMPLPSRFCHLPGKGHANHQRKMGVFSNALPVGAVPLGGSYGIAWFGPTVFHKKVLQERKQYMPFKFSGRVRTLEVYGVASVCKLLSAVSCLFFETSVQHNRFPTLSPSSNALSSTKPASRDFLGNQPVLGTLGSLDSWRDHFLKRRRRVFNGTLTI